MACENGVRARGDCASPATRRKAGGLVLPFPREWGATGWGGLPSRAPYGGAAKWEEEGPGVACPRVHPSRTGQRALVHPPSLRMRKGGAKGGVPTHSLRRWGGAAKGEGRGRGCPASLPRTRGKRWGRGWRREVGRAARTRGKGRVRCGVPPCAPLLREWGREGVACPHAPLLYVYRVGRPSGKGRGWGQRALVRPLPHEWGATDRGKREAAAAACPHVPSFRANVAARMGEKGGPGRLRGGGHCVPLICVRRGWRRSMRGKEGKRHWPALLRPLFDANEVGKGGGRRGGWRPVAEAKRACHGPVSTLWCPTPTFPPFLPTVLLRATRFMQNWVCKEHRTSPPFPVALPSPPPAPFTSKEDARGQADVPPHPLHHTPPRSCADRGVLGRWAHEERAHEGIPPPTLPPVRATLFTAAQGHTAALFARNGGARGSAVPLLRPLPFPLSAPPIRTEGVRMRAPTTALSPSSWPVPSHSREDTSAPPFPHPGAREGAPSLAPRGVYEGTPPRTCGKGHESHATPHLPQPLPFPLRPRHPVHAGKGHAGHATPKATPFAGKGVHKGTEGHPVATGPSPSPFDHTTLYAWERGARARDPQSHPSRSRGRGTMPPSSLGGAAPYTRRGSTRGHAIPDATPFAGKGVHEGTEGRLVATGLPFPLRPRRPVCAGKGRARVHDPRAHPSRSCGRGAHEGHDTPLPLGGTALYVQRGGTRGQATPFTREGAHEATRLPTCCRGWHGLRAPARCFRMPLYDLDKKK
ncbi:hypothetical protein EDB85DRAFT_2216332 [Lactarius pseudohatsudake]|nr:hypothetical protein EDB85DRAFT_2216332 [Lactarius pseudohatsudake]